MWQFWDEFKITEADMAGFWQPDTPVRVADQPDIWQNDAGAVLATSYVVPGKRVLIALGSWSAAGLAKTQVLFF